MRMVDEGIGALERVEEGKGVLFEGGRSDCGGRRNVILEMIGGRVGGGVSEDGRWSGR